MILGAAVAFAITVAPYDRAMLEAAARRAQAVPAPYGYTPHYAMKANPSRSIRTLFRELGLHVDASSDWEVERALRAGFGPAQVQLTSQMPSARAAEHAARGVILNACSLRQLDLFGRAAPGSAIAVRMNPGLRSGSTKRTNTGGPASSFGIWHEYLDAVKKTAAVHRLAIATPHSHIGSGIDPEIWKRATADDARPRRPAAGRRRGEARRRLQGRPHAGGAVGRPGRGSATTSGPSSRPSGRYVLVDNYGGGNCAVIPILSDGSLNPATDVQADANTCTSDLCPVGRVVAAKASPGSVARSGHNARHAHMIEPDPADDYAIATDLDLDIVIVWKFDRGTGKLLTPETFPTSAGAGPRHFAFYPNGVWFYLLNRTRLSRAGWCRR